MPLARIRSFDPEGIAFLAAQLAQSGYTLQFVRPDETDLEEADLELTIIRRDVDEALNIAEAEAERLGVDITIVPGALPAPEPVFAAADIPEPAPFSNAVEMPATVEVPVVSHSIDFEAQKAQLAQAARVSSEKTAHVVGLGVGKAVEGVEILSESIGHGLKSGKNNLVEISDSLGARFRRWRAYFLTARALRREARQREAFSATPFETNQAPRRPAPLWLRERIYMGAAVASSLAVAVIIGWSLAGSGGPANPVGKATGLTPAVQEQVPFGPASANAPAPASVSAARPVTIRVAPVSAQAVKPRPAVVRHTTRPRTVDEADDSEEVVVRHFNRKAVSEQAKIKQREGVKIISEE